MGLSPLKRFQRARQSRVPEGGWTQSKFATPFGRALLRDMVTISRLETGRGVKRMSESMDRIIKTQLEAVLKEVTLRAGRVAGTKAEVIDINFDLPQNIEAALWTEVMEDVLSDFDEAMILSVTNTATSVAHGVFDKTNLTLGYAAPEGAKIGLSQQIAGLAQEITAINETTKVRMSNILEKGLFEQGLTTPEMVREIRDKIPQISRGRVPTIARTEMSRAADKGRVASIQQSGAVTHVSVVGCTGIEANSPTYNGIPTCNIQNVPVADSDQLSFHPNHTGTIVPSRFIEEGGQVPSTTIGTAAQSDF